MGGLFYCAVKEKLVKCDKINKEVELDLQQIKKCKGCECVKLIDEYNRSDGGHGHGATHHPYCKTCCKLRIYAATVLANEEGMTKPEWIKAHSYSKRQDMVEIKYQEFLKNPPELPENKVSEKDRPDPTVNSKQCVSCLIVKHLDDFNSGRALYGKHNYCRECHRDKHRAYTVASKKDGLTTRNWIREFPKAHRMAAVEEAFRLLVEARLNSLGIPAQFDKQDKYTTVDPLLNEVRQRHKEELDKLNNKQTEVQEGFVYIMTNPVWPHAIKVGKAIDYEKRLNQFNTGDPDRAYKLEYTRYFTDRLAAESAAHKALWANHISGEWFRMNPEDAIKTIEAM